MVLYGCGVGIRMVLDLLLWFGFGFGWVVGGYCGFAADLIGLGCLFRNTFGGLVCWAIGFRGWCLALL